VAAFVAATVGTVTQSRMPAQYGAVRRLRSTAPGCGRYFRIIDEAVERLAKVDPDSAMQIAQYPQIIAFHSVPIHAMT
jgi:hypothetical protein